MEDKRDTKDTLPEEQTTQIEEKATQATDIVAADTTEATEAIVETPETDAADSVTTDVATEEAPMPADDTADAQEGVPEATAAPEATTAIDNVPAEDDDAIAAKMERKSDKRKMSRRKQRKQRKRMRILNLAEEGDIRYRGFLSYRALRIIAWVLIILAQAGMLMAFAAKMDGGFAAKVGSWPAVMKYLQNFVTPLFLTAAFATILNNSRKFSSMLILYGGFALVFYALFCLLHDRYLIGMVMVAAELSRPEAVQFVDSMIVMFASTGYFGFNIFIDLFLCTLFTFFVVYRPKKVFVGKYLIIFRLLAILPVAYEIASIVVKIMSSMGHLTLSPYIFPLLTTKPPLTFLVFVALTFFIKKREWLYRRNGKTHEQYQAFLQTKLNSLQFSAFLTIQFVVVAILDLILAVICSMVVGAKLGEGEEVFTQAIKTVSSWGIGNSTPMILVAPFLMLFSYTRTHKDTRMDLIINLIGIIALVLVYLEAAYQGAIYEIDVIKGMFGL